MDELLIDRPKPEILRITLNRPETLNALTWNMVQGLNDTLDSLIDDLDTRVVIITGSGRGFCSGQDMNAAAQRKQVGGVPLPGRFASQVRFGGMAQRMARIPQPVICAVNGVAAGAGMAIALGADIRIGAPATRFLVAAVRIGLGGGESGISYWLPRWIGPARAFEVLLTGRPIEADEALATGLILRKADQDLLQQAAIEQAEAIIANAPFAVSQTKRMMRRNLDAGSLDIALDVENPSQIMTSCTEDYEEALRAFAEKRPPAFKGR